MKAKTFLAIATLLAFGQGAWADGTTSFPLHYDDVNNPEDGSEAHPYQIQSVSDLNALASDVNSGTDYSGKHFILTADLDYSSVAVTDGSNFTPIGTVDENQDDVPFKGVFDGSNYTISGITVNKPEDIYIGLFGCIKYATIKKINLSNCKFTGNWHVGGIVGYGEGSRSDPAFIENCNVDETVEITGVELKYTDDESGEEQTLSGANVGGIIGCCTSMQVKDCTSKAKVTGDEAIGGIVGLMTGTNLAHSILTDCYYTGNSTNVVVGERSHDDLDDNETDFIFTLLDSDASAAINNAARLANYNGLEASVTLSGRTLYKDNSWNTICLPFAMTAAQVTTQLAPTKLMTLSTATLTDGTLTLNFADATEIEAGKPYIIKWTGNTEWGNPTFTGVTVSSAAPADVEGTAANFHGIYTPYSTGGENKSMLYLGANNTLYYPNAAMTINAFRAYFTLNGIEAGPASSSAPAAVRAFVLNFGDGDGATGILSLSADSKDSEDNAAWYDMQGRRLSGKPTASGIYINNGNKIVIK